MKRGAIVSTILIGLVGLLNIGCGGSPAVAPADTGMSAGPCPEWFANPPTDADHIYAASTATSRDLQMAMDKARTTGRLELASQIEVHIQGLTTKFAEEVGAGDDAVLLGKTSIATKQVLSGIRTNRGTPAPSGTLTRAIDRCGSFG